MTLLKIKYPQGGEVIVPPFTWVSDIASVIQCGFTPIFVDIDINTMGMNLEGIKSKLTEKQEQFFYHIFKALMLCQKNC